jgi:hypothetical protein
MMHSIDCEYTDKNISAWGGLSLLQELMDRIDFRLLEDESGLPDRGTTSSE